VDDEWCGQVWQGSGKTVGRRGSAPNGGRPIVRGAYQVLVKCPAHSLSCALLNEPNPNHNHNHNHTNQTKPKPKHYHTTMKPKHNQPTKPTTQTKLQLLPACLNLPSYLLFINEANCHYLDVCPTISHNQQYHTTNNTT